MWSFNPDKFEFWQIYDCIKRYYPIGVRKDNPKLFNSYSGLQALADLLITQVHDEKKYQANWVDFSKGIEQELGYPVIGTTYGQAPSYSASLQLSVSHHWDLTRTKELCMFVSLIGPFYTVIGQDRNSINVGDLHFSSTNYLAVSPDPTLGAPFEHLCAKIESRFVGYRFVPFAIYSQVIDGLNLKYTDEEQPNIFAALFNTQVDCRSNLLGDQTYKMNDWIRKDYQDNGLKWTSQHPNNQHRS